MADDFDINNIVYENDETSPEKSAPKRGAEVAKEELTVSPPSSTSSVGTETPGAFDLSNIEFEEQVPQRTDRQIATQNLRDQFSPIPPEVVDNVLTPLFEVGRGAFLGVSDVADTANSVSEFIGTITGTEAGGFFEQVAKEQGNIAQNIPETGASGFAKTVYQLAGMIPAITAEFGLVKIPKSIAGGLQAAEGAIKGTSKAVSKIPGELGRFMATSQGNVTGKFAVLEGLDEFAKEKAQGGDLLEQAGAVGKGATRGATTALTFGILANASKILHAANKNVAGAYVAFTTGNKELGKDFARNPGKYNVNPLSGKTKTKSQIKEENDLIKQKASGKMADEKQRFAAWRKQRSQSKKDARDKAMNDLQATQKEISVKMNETGEMTIQEGSAKATAVAKKKNEAHQDQAVPFYDDALSKFVQIRKQAGEAVGNAVNATINRNPNASIPFKLVNDPFKATMKKFSPFGIKNRRGGGQNVIPKTGVRAPGNKQEIDTLQSVLDDFNSKKAAGGLSVKYLQDLKNELRKLSNQAYKGQNPNNELGKLYKELANDVNPATLVTRNKSLSKDLHEIATANRDFASLVPKYEAAMKHYFKEVNGQWVPNPNNAIRAIASNNKVVTREMERADLLLEKGDQLFPKMQEMVRQADKAFAIEKGMTKSIKLAVNREKAALAAAHTKAVKELRASHDKISSTQRRVLAEEINNYNRGKQLQHNDMLNKMHEAEKFALQQEQLRSFAGSTNTPAGIIQRVAAFGVLLPKATGDISSAYAPLSLVLGLSPIQSALGSKLSLGATGGFDKMLGAVMRGESSKMLSKSKVMEQITGAQIGSRLAVTPEGKDALDSVLGR
jgi:hypothetical protein